MPGIGLYNPDIKLMKPSPPGYKIAGSNKPKSTRPSSKTADTPGPG